VGEVASLLHAPHYPVAPPSLRASHVRRSLDKTRRVNVAKGHFEEKRMVGMRGASWYANAG